MTNASGFQNKTKKVIERTRVALHRVQGGHKTTMTSKKKKRKKKDNYYL